MFDIDTFLTTLYVTVDDFCKQHRPPQPTRRGPNTALSPSEVITLALFGQWSRFNSERDFYRFAQQRLVPLFPTLPHRSQFSRLQRLYQADITAFGLHLAQILNPQGVAYEILDRCGIATRWCGRRGVGWLPEYTDKGICSRLGYFHGLHLLSAVTPEGVLTGFGLGPASAKDQPMAQSLFLLRHGHGHCVPQAAQRQQRLLPQVGQALGAGFYVLDKGFSGPARHKQWREAFGVQVVCAPQKGHGKPWPKDWCIWLASLRQRIETVHDKLLNAFRLCRERPHALEGIFARLGAKMALHNFCIWLNKAHGRQPLAFADLLAW